MAAGETDEIGVECDRDVTEALAAAVHGRLMAIGTAENFEAPENKLGKPASLEDGNLKFT